MYSGDCPDRCAAFSWSACRRCATTRSREEAVEAALRVEAAEAVDSPLTEGVDGREAAAGLNIVAVAGGQGLERSDVLG